MPPHNLSYGHPDIVPATTGGAVIDQPPGQIAATVKRLQFSVAQRGNELKSELLQRLDSLPARREPVFRASAPNTPDQFYGKMTRMIANVEATLMQVVGTPPDRECLHCRRSNGIFHQCIRVRGVTTHCANCHWNGKSTRCDLPRGTPPPSAFAHTDDASLLAPTNENPPPHLDDDDSVTVDPPTFQAPNTDPSTSQTPAPSTQEQLTALQRQYADLGTRMADMKACMERQERVIRRLERHLNPDRRYRGRRA